MSPALIRFVLLVSCAHALVHVYELALPSTEQLIAQEFEVDTATTGKLGTAFRLPFGLLALVVGLLVDRFGARPMLVTYLLGCAAFAGYISQGSTLGSLYVGMFALGSFASIYHPAGLALLSHETSAANRPRALGLHGIFGSLGIGGAPFLAGMILSVETSTWRTYFGFLVLPGAILALALLLSLRRQSARAKHAGTKQAGAENSAQDTKVSSGGRRSETASRLADEGNWRSYFLLTLFGAISGFIYAAYLTFLPRYMHGAGFSHSGVSSGSIDNYFAGSALLLGMIGQYTAGRLARPDRLESMLAGILWANAPLLAWMAFAQGAARVPAAALFALVHFMNQPIYNSLIAAYSPRRRRSACYGFSFLMSFGVGAFGSWFAGRTASDATTYGTLALLAIAAGLIALVLRAWNRPGA